ncbi:nitrate- and nitrite sensing domain-containing protein [Vibrio hangzhouensis]|uniref:Nitrate and nitrite sensing n=1 Tax=Vibrio hangzhouensis TaxID=462991 RepID=A0A1H5T611_9VIBR|nr:nitrate- and nitrite sensing domain-containing protein [Vibrio hangzhouensis]SEF58253.1 Nitrate and nitrite sensing [Vibrio hangzhouensis]
MIDTVMANLQAIVVMLFVALGVVVIVWKRGSALSKSQKVRQSGLAHLTTLRQLLAAIQQHRGITNGVLCGDDKLQSRLPALQSDINNHLQTLARLDDGVRNTNSWRSVEENWPRVRVQFKKWSAEQNLFSHNQLLASLLESVEECAQHYRLTELPQKEGESIALLWNDLLRVAECVGQARALGTGVAAKAACSSVERIRLKYLHQSIHRFVTVQNHSDYPTVKRLLGTIENKVLVLVPSVAAVDYFDDATAALDEVFRVFDERVTALSDRV